jgi:muramoyltetrapeptide carboxypeptidase
MDRRSFVKKSTIAGALSTLPITGFSRATTDELSRVFPSRLEKGSTVGLIAPGSSLTRTAFEKTLNNLTDIGFKVKYSPNIKVRSGFLAGTDQQRVEDIHRMFADEDVSAIVCARGGYGCARLLELIDYTLIRNNPKPFLGYSDITALHSAFYKHAGLVTFHGPVGSSEWNDFSLDYFTDIVSKGKRVKIRAEDPVVISDGSAEGPLFGGNLSLLASLIGTPHEPQYDGHILFIEEIGESSYRVDRMLTQLRSSGRLHKLAGIALGYFTNCDVTPEQTGYEQSIGLLEVFKDRLGDLGIPVVFGFPFGHEAHNATLPLGINARLVAEKGIIKLIEKATR